MTLICIDKDPAKTVMTSIYLCRKTGVSRDLDLVSWDKLGHCATAGHVSLGNPCITDGHIILLYANISIIGSFWSHMHAEHVGASYGSWEDTWKYTYMCVSEEF